MIYRTSFHGIIMQHNVYQASAVLWIPCADPRDLIPGTSGDRSCQEPIQLKVKAYLRRARFAALWVCREVCVFVNTYIYIIYICMYFSNKHQQLSMRINTFDIIWCWLPFISTIIYVVFVSPTNGLLEHPPFLGLPPLGDHDSNTPNLNDTR